MASPSIDLVGVVAEPSTQGLGRLIGQYTRSPKLIGLLQGLYELGQDLDDTFQKVARVMNPLDDITLDPGTASAGQSGSGGTGPDGTVNQQLDIAGHVVGIARVLPDQALATNALFLALIQARIVRNRVRGGTFQQMIDQVVRIFSATDDDLDVVVSEPGRMTALVFVGRFLSDTEASIFSISMGVNFIPGNILPRPTGVRLLLAAFDTGCFCFSDASDPGVPLQVGGTGFNTTVEATTGRWARAYT